MEWSKIVLVDGYLIQAAGANVASFLTLTHTFLGKSSKTYCQTSMGNFIMK